MVRGFGDNSNDLLEREKILQIFEYLNRELYDNKLYLDLTLYGGSLMTLLYDVRPATRDIDCVFNDTDTILLNNILNQVKSVFQLQDDWINEDIKEPLSVLVKEDKTDLLNYSNLKIYRPIPEQLLAMKILASRPEPSNDFIDAYLLCKDLNIKSKEELLDIVGRYVPLYYIKDRQIMFIKYLGEDLGYDWK